MADLKTALTGWQGKTGMDIGDSEKAKIDAANELTAQRNAAKKGIDTRKIDPSERQPYKLELPPPAPTPEQGEYVTVEPTPRAKRRIFNASVPFKIRKIMSCLDDNDFRTVQILSMELNGSESSIQNELNEMEVHGLVRADKTRRPHRWYNARTAKTDVHIDLDDVRGPTSAAPIIQILNDMEVNLQMLQSQLTLIRDKVSQYEDPDTEVILALLRKRMT